MATRHLARLAAQRRNRRAQRAETEPRKTLYSRMLCYEPLEERRLLALVTVDTRFDTVDLTDGLTSLREAIFATNLVAGPDIIQFAPSLTASGPVTISLTQGELRITDDLNVDGPGANLLTLDATGSDLTPDENNGDGSRIFQVDDASLGTLRDVFISGLTLTGGDVRGRGGAILSSENLAVLEARLVGNAAIADNTLTLSYGGAIAQLGGNLTVSDTTILHNSGDFGGGIYFEDGGLLLTLVVIAENTGLSGAGIYFAGGTGQIRASVIRGNSAGAFSLGGGIYASGNLRVESTTISGNSADYGGGIFSRTDASNMESTLIVNSTISGNTAFSRGGGVRNAYGQTRIEFSTITGNTSPPGQGSGVASRGYDTSRTSVWHSIIAGNTNSDVDFATGNINTFTSNGFNLIGTGSAVGAFNTVGDQTGVTNPLLGPLADNGGPPLPGGNKLLTHALLPGSPAINAGDLNVKAGVGGVPLYDQRGEPSSRVVNGRIDIGAFEYQSPSDLNLVVDILDDESDNDHGVGDLSLREAIELANLYPSDDTIRFDPALTAAGPATILLTMRHLGITDGVSIEGPGAEFLTIDASGNDQTPMVNDGRGSSVFRALVGNDSVSIRGLRLAGGDTQGDGGAIFSFSNLTVADCIIIDNAAGGRGGGAISSVRHSLTVVRSIISGNSAREQGGGIRKDGGVLIVDDSTIRENTAAENGGGIFAYRNVQVQIRDSTLLNNSTPNLGGALYLLNGASESTIDGTIVTGNSAGDGGGIWSGLANLTVAGSTISGNTASALGGGIMSSSVLKLVGSIVSGNSAAVGGGIAVEGHYNLPESLSLIGSTISDNHATLDGGGIFSSRAYVTAIGSTINNNQSERIGGGIAFRDPSREGEAAISLTQSTISGNGSKQHGGGVYVDGHPDSQHSISHSTISLNVSDSDDSGSGLGGGLFVKSGKVLLDHTIAAGNHDNSGVAPDVAGIINARFSLIGFGSAFLGPLAANGGPTMTHALLPGSPAINAGDPAAMAGVGGVPEFDQRGAPFARVYGGRIDIGAYEAQPNPLAGDYNFNGVVDAADIVVWRKTLNSTADLRADGNGDGVVNQADWQVWRANFGRTAASIGQGARSTESEANQAPPQRAAWQPPASPGVSVATSRLAFRPPPQRFVSDDELLASLAPPRASNHARNDFVPARRLSMRDASGDSADANVDAVDSVFETLGAS